MPLGARRASSVRLEAYAAVMEIAITIVTQM